MFNSTEARQIASRVLDNASSITGPLGKAFENASVNTVLEVTYFRNLINDLKSRFSPFPVGGLNITLRAEEIHQKPIVNVPSQNFSCELGDLLVVVKYDLKQTPTFEKKSIIYQAKMCQQGGSNCVIDQNQLNLLRNWPTFEFGRDSKGNPQSFSAVPTATEFGSYILAQRGPSSGQHIILKYPPPAPLARPEAHYESSTYSVAPEAREVHTRGPKTVAFDAFDFTLGDVNVFFDHLAFQRGEHHNFNSEVKRLVDALYRHHGWQADPPAEFRGYSKSVEEEQPGFFIIEWTVESE